MTFLSVRDIACRPIVERLGMPPVKTQGRGSSDSAQKRHARAYSYQTVARIDDLAVKVSSFGSTQKVHDLCRLSRGAERLAFKIPDLVHAIGAIECLHLGIDNARRKSVDPNTPRIRFLDRKDAC